MATATKPRVVLGSLKPLLDAEQLDDAPLTPQSEEAPRMALDLIDEDPNQPRRQHNVQTLHELADSITAAGDVLQPVSLRPNPDVPGRYIINFGHRRCRAARLAGMCDVPYFIARKVSSFAQVIENEQRDDLSPLDLAMFIRDREAEGMSRQEIAQRLGKSKGYISKAAALFDPPAVVVEALQAGRVKGVGQAYELAKLHADHPEAVRELVVQGQEITRTAIDDLRERLKAPPGAASPALEPKPVAAPAAAAPQAKAKPATPVVMAEYKGQPLVLDTATVPPEAGHFYGRRPGASRRLMVPAGEVRLVGFSAA